MFEYTRVSDKHDAANFSQTTYAKMCGCTHTYHYQIDPPHQCLKWVGAK